MAHEVGIAQPYISTKKAVVAIVICLVILLLVLLPVIVGGEKSDSTSDSESVAVQPASEAKSVSHTVRVQEIYLQPNRWSDWVDVQLDEGVIVDHPSGWHEFYFWNGERVRVPLSGRAFFDNLAALKAQHRSFCLRGSPGVAKVTVYKNTAR